MKEQEKTISIQNVDTLNVYFASNNKTFSASLSEITDFKTPKEPNKKSRSEQLIRILELSSKIVSLIAGLSLAALTIILLLGIRQIGVVQISGLLKVMSISFIGSIFSIGGLKLVSLEANFRKQKEKLEILTQCAQPIANFKGSAKLSSGWQHFLFPSSDMLLVYGHECKAKLYKYNLENFNFDCIWTYGDEVNIKTHFAQSAARYKDQLFALGDYSTGAITIYNLALNSHYSVALPKTFVSQLAFSSDGCFLSIVCGHDSNSVVYILRLSSRELTTVQGSGPVAWLDDSRIILLRNLTIFVYHVSDGSEEIFHKSHSKITHIATDGQLVVFAQSDDKLSTIYCGEHNNSEPASFLRIGCDLEQLDVIGGSIIIATSWNGSSSDCSKLKLVGLDGELAHEFIYDSGYGHGYRKYSVLNHESSFYFSMTGKNGVIPFFDLSNRNIGIKLVIKENEQLPKIDRWVCAQLNAKESGLLMLSLLSHEGIIAVFDIDLKNPQRGRP